MKFLAVVFTLLLAGAGGVAGAEPFARDFRRIFDDPLRTSAQALQTASRELLSSRGSVESIRSVESRLYCLLLDGERFRGSYSPEAWNEVRPILENLLMSVESDLANTPSEKRYRVMEDLSRYRKKLGLSELFRRRDDIVNK